MPTEFPISLLSSELPLDGLLGRISRALPVVNLALEGWLIGNAAVQALAIENTDLDLRHVQPACMFGGVVKLHAPQQLVAGMAPQDALQAVAKVPYSACPRRYEPGV